MARTSKGMALPSTDEAGHATSSVPSSLPSGAGAQPAARPGRRSVLSVAATAAVLGGLALLGALRGWQGRGGTPARGAGLDWEGELIEALDSKEASFPESGKTCTDYPKLELVKCLHNNLALKGPDQGDEGMVFVAKNMNTGREIELVVNAVSSYTPFSPRMNGMSGEYGTLNLQSGSSVKVRFSVRHPDSKEPVVLPSFALTFFDLDQGLSDTSKESVTVNGFAAFALSDDVEPGSGSEVKVVDNPDGSRTFHSSTFGTGADNPKHPLRLNQKQKNRAVSLRFKDFKASEVTFAASNGLEPRFFTFVPYPALVCSENYKMSHLADLKVSSSETPIVADHEDTFQKWFVKTGQEVQPGTELCSVKRQDQSIHIYRAPVKGKVVRYQAGLKEGDVVGQRLDDKTIVVIATEKQFPSLPAGPDDAQTAAPAGMIFKQFHVMENDVVLAGDPIADITNSQGQVTTLTAAKAGPITARQAIEPGDSCDRVQDGNLATIGRLEKLPVGQGSSATNVPPGSTFLRYLSSIGDSVSMNAPVAEVMVNGKVQEVQTVVAGTVTARQESLLKGMSIDEAMEDRDIVVVGKGSARFPPLAVKPGQHPAAVPPGMKFESWHKATGDIVNEGDRLLDVRNTDGDLQTLAATGTGIVMERQDKLERGMAIDSSVVDHNLMVIGKLPPLKVETGEAASNVPSGAGYTFKDYRVSPGDVVKKGDAVAEVTAPDGSIHTVPSTKYGKVKSRQEKMREGASIEGVMEDRDLVVVGKFPAVAPSGLRQTSINAPPDAIFEEYYIKENQKVEVGQKIAKVRVPEGTTGGARRLAFGGVSQDITSPTWGTVTSVQPLVPGRKISEQQEGSSIVTLDQGPPWWLGLLFVLMVLFCCLCLLFGVMQKPVPYEPMPEEEVPEPEQPLIEEEPEPDGLRLDFEYNDKIHTVYAQRRPLGIKHNFVAPIVVNDFTINSYAKLELGVKEGWKLRRIGKEELYDNPSFDEVNGKLCDYMKDFELWPLPIDFRRSHGSSEVTTVEFRQRPIGLEFTNRAPIKVSKIYPNSPAKAALIEQGWFVTRIGEADVTQNSNFREVIGYFNEGVQPLDEVGLETVLSKN